MVDNALELGVNEGHQVRTVLRVAPGCLQDLKARPNMNVVLDLLKDNLIDGNEKYEKLPPNLPKMKNIFEAEQRKIFGHGQRWRKMIQLHVKRGYSSPHHVQTCDYDNDIQIARSSVCRASTISNSLVENEEQFVGHSKEIFQV
ncbi:hypothetical protein Mapa_007475 [Marchantia paleacea]|nr:hypothetical protein Mapa_007475 [Marchantia paleacea]